ncbi:cysteine desulfurase family protein [Thiomonas sp. X19]|uniref:cysteine desulfurase family protein n=1 Tax=Thiomonas sp. X19 TaxID=1050370 RepID=UPI000DD6437D|nr:cysteine desulfurase family protein [Thiomonas sp. X19]
MIYLDHNATTPVAAEALQEMRDVLERVWANPSSAHGPGQAARRVLADARTRIARFLGCGPTELVFTSGATEANHMAVLGACNARRRGAHCGRRRLVLSAVEHPSMMALAARVRDSGCPVDVIPVDGEGRLDLQAAHALIDTDVVLVSVMGANNETGVLMPVAELAEIAHTQGALLHVDATQVVGKSVQRFADSAADLWSVSAHKFNGPKGVGALVVRKGLDWPGLLAGNQERGRRGGTENLPGIAGFAAAAEGAALDLAADVDRMTALRERFESGLKRCSAQLNAPLTIYGCATQRLPNTSLVRFGELKAEHVLRALERTGVIAASGSACCSGRDLPSHVLLAQGESPQYARCAVRFSLGRHTTSEEIDAALLAVQRVLGSLLNTRH